MWWGYGDIALNGPKYWGVMNPEWALCQYGRQQSPINIEPSRLLYDPNLKHLQIDSTLMKGLVINNGTSFKVELLGEGYSSVNISLGPLSYRYRAVQLLFHFANVDYMGSEHKIAGKSFPVEMHVMAYNADLYKNVSQAMKGVKGIVMLAVFMEIGKEINKPFYAISKELSRLPHIGNKSMVHHLDLKLILPKTEHYITYEGSLTQPGCYETVTWIVFNKPAFISREQLSALRVLYNGAEEMPETPTELQTRKEESNARPIMPLNHRAVRTNINHRKRSRLCTMERDNFYQVNEIYLKT